MTALMVMAEISGQEAATESKNPGCINNSFPYEKHSMIYMSNSSFHHQINFEKQAPTEESFPILYMRKPSPGERWPQVAASKGQGQNASSKQLCSLAAGAWLSRTH